MFTKQQHTSFLELSNDLQDENDWVIGHLRTLNIPLNITAIALEPVTKLLAIGTSSGSIFIYGGPGVDVKITTPSSVSVKFLNFSLPSRKILCIDDNNQLHVWDLATFGAPEYLTSARFDHVNSIHVSPSLSHVFLALQLGEIRTYDLGCLRKSPYTVPNMWKLYQQDSLAKGVPSIADSNSQPCVDQVLHPRDLSKIFVAYEGGVVLCDITDRKTIRAYELVLPPGAPGGGHGFGDILTHRQPPVTCLAIHPSGHFFAVGHADGCLAFWAVDDDTFPLTVFTFDEDNVHLVDSVKLEAHLQTDDHAAQKLLFREPIIKMAWSGYSNSPDPRGGETTLTVLGGLDPTHGGNATVLWFPPFQPPAPPSGTKTQPGELDPFFRAAMEDTLAPIDLVEYAVGGEIQDFLLVPRENPHYAGQYDPYAVLFLVATKGGDRVIRAYSFPPSRTIQIGNQSSGGVQPSQSPESGAVFGETPDLPPFVDLNLPFSPLGGAAGLRGGHLLTLEADAYEKICEAGKSPSQTPLAVKLDGGQAFADQTKHDEIRLTKYQPHRLMITYNANLRVLFFDVSAQLLVGGELEALTGHFPNPLLGLTVELESVWGELLSRGKCTTSDSPAIQAVHLAAEALEVATVLDTGEVVVHRFHSPPASSKASHSNDVILLHSSSIETQSQLSPYFCLKKSGKVEACSISDIGFLAVSYSTGCVVIVDMRGPSVIYSSGSITREKHRLSVGSHHGADIAKSLTWTISRLEKDEQLRVRLIVARSSGTQEVITLLPSGSPATWGLSGEPVATHGVSDPLHDGVFVHDSKTGTRIDATGSLLAASYRSESPNSPPILIAVGAKGARTYANINGDRIGKADWGIRAGNAIAAQVVQRMASRALAVVTDKEEVLTYSLPHLELITRFKQLPLDGGHLSIDHSGDFLAFSPSPSSKTISQIIYGTLFDIRRAYSPAEVDFAMKPCKFSQPQPISMGPPSLVGTWLSFGQSTSGDQLDNILGGPDRAELVAQRSRQAPGGSPSGAAGGSSTTAASLAASAASAQASIYNKLSSALGERGQLLGGLEESFKSLEQGSQGMVTQAKKLAAQQSAKSWFGF